MRTLVRLQKQIEDLPYAAETLKRVEAGLGAELAALDKQLAEAPLPEPTPAAPGSAPPPAPAPDWRQPRFTVDTRLGFKKQNVIASSLGASPVLVQRDTRRFVSYTEYTLEYPLTKSSTAILTVPYLFQTLRTSALGRVSTRRGSGVGDMVLLAEYRLPETAAGTQLTVAGGMEFPTGKDPFGLKPGELPTGIGFYQPMVRLTLQKLLVPLQMYGTVEYRTSFHRRIEGLRTRVPDSYGGEIGFAYVLGPEWSAQTSVSMRQVNQPFLLGPGATAGYLSQLLTYRAGGRTELRGSLDIGLTNDSLDFLAGAAVRGQF